MNYKKITQGIFVGYATFIIILYFFQSWFIYHPKTFEAYDKNKLTEIGATIVSDAGLDWLYLPSKTVSNKILVYFHGNAGAVIDRAWKASFWRDRGFNIVLAEYPGYGTNNDKPNEQSFYNAGRIILNKTLLNFPDAKIYFYGESIGSGAAVQMATEYENEALIIVSGFSSLVDVAFSKLPFIPTSLLLRDKYDNKSKIENINSRLIWMHGEKDGVVPIRFGQKLYDAYKGEKDFLIFDNAGHNDIYTKADMNAVIRDFKL